MNAVARRVTTNLVNNASGSGRLWGDRLEQIGIHIATLPYYRLFHFNTLQAIRRVAEIHCRPDKFPELVRMLSRWRERKLQELQFISIACTVLAGAVIGSFSWQWAADGYWLGSAFWYCSLVLSVLGILLAAQQMAVLSFLGHIPKDHRSPFAGGAVDRYLPLMLKGIQRNASKVESPGSTFQHRGQGRPSRIMIFTWQCPVMFMSYSVCLFLSGLTLLVITPLIRIRQDGWTTNANVAVFYLAGWVVAGPAFAFVSFWIYHFVDMDTDMMPLEEEPDEEEPMMRDINFMTDLPPTAMKLRRETMPPMSSRRL